MPERLPTNSNQETKETVNPHYEQARMVSEMGLRVLEQLAHVHGGCGTYYAHPRSQDQFIVKFYGGNADNPGQFYSFEMHCTPTGSRLYQVVNSGGALDFAADFESPETITEDVLRTAVDKKLEEYKTSNIK